VSEAQATLATEAALEWQAQAPELSFRFERRDFDVNAQDTVWIAGDETIYSAAKTTWGTGAPGASYMRVKLWTHDAVAHEFGHAMGLEHAKCGVMRPKVNPYRDDGVQACDVERLRASWGR